MRSSDAAAKWIAVIIVLLLTVGGAFGISTLIRALTEPRIGETMGLPLNDVRYIEPVGNRVVTYNGSELNCFTSAGKDAWKEPLGIGAGYSVKACPEGIATWRDGSYSIWNLNDGGTLSSGNVDEDILSVRVGGKYFAVLFGDDDNCAVRVLDTTGRPYDEVHFESEVVLDYGFFSDGSMMWVLSADTSGTVPTCKLTTYRPSRKAMSGSIGESEQVVYHVQFEKSSICLVGEDFVKQYDYTGAEYKQLRTLVYGWFMVDMSESEENPLMAFAPNTQVKNTPEISDVRLINGSTDVILRMPFPCRNLVVKNDRLYGFAADYVMTATVSDSKVKAYTLPMRIDGVAGVTDDHVGVLKSNGAYYLVRLP